MTGHSIRLDSDDLARVRLGRLHPMWELEDAAHLRIVTGSAMARTWFRHTQSRLGRRGTQVVRDLRTGAVQYSAYGISPTESVSDLGACLETALRRPTRQWAEQLDIINVPGWHLPAPGISAGLARLEHSTLAFYEAAVAPYWRSAEAEADRAIAKWSDIVTREGVGAMLARLHPEITWAPPFLQVATKPADRVCPPGCVHLEQEVRWQAGNPRREPTAARPSSAGLMLLPTVFGHTCTIQGMPNAVEVVSVPIPVRPTVFADAPPAAHPAEQLLGASRAWILQACVDNELTTSGIARLVGVSVSSASEHASTLRRTGLLASRREGQVVLHQATPLGRQLMHAEGEGDDLPARRFLASDQLPRLASAPP